MIFNVFYESNRIEIENPTKEIIELTKDKKIYRKDIALFYAMAIKQNYNPNPRTKKPDWELINKAILERWSFYGLNWIKELAWKIAKGEK